MRKPRDIDAELKALSDKAKGLKAKRVLQLGELVTVTGADTLDLETLTGALLAAVNGAKSADQKEAWRSEGAAFFQRRGRKGRSGVETSGPGDVGGAGSSSGGDPAL
ncbi:MAG: conjugal transfer protein TraC [Sphingomonadales bacterium 32-67-7]|nr:MAG: conjugal transfer protein TraC [Sphingomonadales bacterium 32-67-7]